MGLCQGSPEMIPFVKQDYMFAAICEELGGLFAICMILICMSMFLLVVNISLRIKKRFYKLIALGLWNRVCLSGISYHWRGYQVYSDDRNYPASGKLWRKFCT